MKQTKEFKDKCYLTMIHKINLFIKSPKVAITGLFISRCKGKNKATLNYTCEQEAI